LAEKYEVSPSTIKRIWTEKTDRGRLVP
jgi:hypothetical protein